MHHYVRAVSYGLDVSLLTFKFNIFFISKIFYIAQFRKKKALSDNYDSYF